MFEQFTPFVRSGDFAFCRANVLRLVSDGEDATLELPGVRRPGAAHMSATAATHLLDDLRTEHLLSATQLETVEKELGKFRSGQELVDELVNRDWLTKLQADQVLSGFAHDLNVGRYQLMEVIGEGGMGLVFKAKDTKLNRLVALKTIHTEVLDRHPEALRRFHREAQAAAQLNHPNVVVLYESHEADGIHYLALEFVEGIDLHRMVQQQGALPIPVACEYIRQAAAGLQHAHEAGLIHRDIKPSNLLVTQPNKRRSSLQRKSGVHIGAASPTPPPSPGRQTGVGTIKILDMGLARLTEALDDSKSSALTQAGTVIGTPDFIAPEQARDASLVDHRADLYSLGCTFFFLLTGRPPFPEGSSVEKLVKHQKEQPKPALEEIRRGVPSEVVQTVNRLMEKNPSNRYQSAQEVVDRLDEIRLQWSVGNGGGNAAPATVVSASTPSAPTAAASFGLDSIVIPARKAAVLEGHAGLVQALAFSPNGRLLASGGLDGVVHLWKDVDQPRPEILASLRQHVGEVAAIAFSPGKPFLITGSAPVLDGHMWRWAWEETDERKARTTLPREPFGVDTLAFSADGKRLAAATSAAVVFWSETRRGITWESAMKGHGAPVKALAFSPDGKRLALACEDTTIRLWEFGWFKTSQKAVCEGHTDALATISFSPDGRWLASAGPDRRIRVWDAAASGAVRPTAELDAHTAPVRLVQFTPRQDLLVSIGDGGQVFLWNVATKSVVQEWLTEKNLALSVALSPDGRWLATGMKDGRVYLYDLDLMLTGPTPA